MNRNKIGAVIFGTLIIILGLSIIMKFTIPVFRILFGAFVIYLGIVIIFKRNPFRNNSGALSVFGSYRVRADKKIEKEYNCIFAQGLYDFTGSSVPVETIKTHISVTFAGAKIKINRDLPIKISANSAFASVKLPDNFNLTFGSYIYTTPAFDETKPYIFIECEVVFAGLIIE